VSLHDVDATFDLLEMRVCREHRPEELGAVHRFPADVSTLLSQGFRVSEQMVGVPFPYGRRLGIALRHQDMLLIEASQPLVVEVQLVRLVSEQCVVTGHEP
jgi:hypothetical protein